MQFFFMGTRSRRLAPDAVWNLLFQKYTWKSSFSLAISPEICYTILYLIVILGSEKHGNVFDSL